MVVWLLGKLIIFRKLTTAVSYLVSQRELVSCELVTILLFG